MRRALVAQLASAPLFGSTSARRWLSSKSDLLKGVRVLQTPEEREENATKGGSLARAEVYKKTQEEEVRLKEAEEGGSKQDNSVEARILREQKARFERMSDRRAVAASGGGGVTRLSLDARFKQMERDGDLKNLEGFGKPLKHRHQTHFGGEDAVDRMLERIMSEQNCKPESLERKDEYMGKLRAFRKMLDASAEAGGAGKPLRRAGMEEQIAGLRVLLKHFDDAAIKDALLHRMPIYKLPAVGNLDDEIEAARARTASKEEEDAAPGGGAPKSNGGGGSRSSTRGVPSGRRRSFATSAAGSAPRIKTYALSSTSVAAPKPGCVARTNTGHSISTDLPRLAGGDDAAPQPVELLLAGLLGCKTATAHFVARHLWPRPHHRLHSIEFADVVAERDERGALALPMTATPPATAALLRVRGVARVRPASPAAITAEDVAALGECVEQRCPVAATLTAAGCKMDFEWVLADSE